MIRITQAMVQAWVPPLASVGVKTTAPVLLYQLTLTDPAAGVQLILSAEPIAGTLNCVISIQVSHPNRELLDQDGTPVTLKYGDQEQTSYTDAFGIVLFEPVAIADLPALIATIDT
ncbi:MAG: hypothetical protein HC782_04505, partial [Gammaproteobacteria bacterium]|nr:hypothetical protein [Gammaproteobacteria bacterium]